MTLEPGQMLTHHRLVEKLGEGGMGVVWKAVDTALDREVAIKILPDVFSEDPERLARFEREAKLLASLNHANIATIHGIEQAEGVRFLVMELVDGEDLAERLSRGPLAVEEALAYSVQIAEALEAAHEQGVIHRDLKPANVKVTNEGKVKVLDFGLAKALSSETTGASNSPSLSPTVTSAGTAAGVILGSAAYMSPEQAKGKPVDRRADIWAFGAVLHEMLTGRRLFHGDSISETLAAVLMSEPDMGSLPVNTPRRVRRLIERCLRKDPQSRLRDIGDARVVLEESLAGHEWKTAGAAVGVAAASRPSMRWAVPLLLAGVAVGAIGGFLLSRSPATERGGVTRVSVVSRVSENPWPLVSPDGRTLVYAGKDGAYRRQLGAYDETLIRGTEGLTYFNLSPDGKWLAFVRDSTQPKLLKVPVDGSAPPLELATLPAGANGLVWLESGALASVTVDPHVLILVPEDGGAPESLELSTELGENFFILTGSLPGGRYVLAAVDTYGERGWQMNVATVDIRTGETRILVEGGVFAAWSPTGHLLFTRRDTLQAVPFDVDRVEILGGAVAIREGLKLPAPELSGWFDVSREGTLVYRSGVGQFSERLVIVDPGGGVETWSEERRDFDYPLAVSADGRTLVAKVLNWDEGLEELWISAMDRPRLRPLVDEANMDCFNPVWSPDAKDLYYACVGSGKAGGLYRVHLDGTARPELLLARESTETAFYPTSVSPDGAALLISRLGGPDAALLLLPLGQAGSEVGTPKVIATEGIGLFFGARFSPDGKWIAYQFDGTGRREVYIRSIGSDGALGATWLVSPDGGSWPLWAKTKTGDRLELLYGNEDKGLAISIATSPELRIGEPREILDLGALRASIVEPLPDGRFLIAQREDEQTEVAKINVELNWFEELERLVPRPD